MGAALSNTDPLLSPPESSPLLLFFLFIFHHSLGNIFDEMLVGSANTKISSSNSSRPWSWLKWPEKPKGGEIFLRVPVPQWDAVWACVEKVDLHTQCGFRSPENALVVAQQNDLSSWILPCSIWLLPKGTWFSGIWFFSKCLFRNHLSNIIWSWQWLWGLKVKGWWWIRGGQTPRLQQEQGAISPIGGWLCEFWHHGGERVALKELWPEMGMWLLPLPWSRREGVG